MLSSLSNLINFKKTKNQRKIFNNILSFADSVIEEAGKFERTRYLNYVEHPIIDVIRILGRTIQSEHLVHILKYDDNLPSIAPSGLFFDFNSVFLNSEISFYEIKRELKVDKNVSLKKDLILPWPWNRNRLINCISSIGKSRAFGDWKQDKQNHSIELWLPIGISWVYGGNHSISAGIAQGNGELKPSKIYDISGIYDYVYCDGVNYISIHDSSVIESVRNIEFAAIFEIGRKMISHNISF